MIQRIPTTDTPPILTTSANSNRHSKTAEDPPQKKRPEVEHVQTYAFDRSGPTPMTVPSSPGEIDPRLASTFQGPNPVPPTSGKAYAEQNPEFFKIDLPSNFLFYPFKTLSARHMKGVHQAKMNRAAQEGSLRHVVDCIGSTLEPGVSAYDLTPQDFYFVMYWQRVFSYPKTPQKITTRCENPEHIKQVADGSKSLESLTIIELVGITTLKQTYLTLENRGVALEAVLSPRALDLWKENKDLLHVETMRDLVEATEILDRVLEEKKTTLLEAKSEKKNKATIVETSEIANTTVEQQALLEGEELSWLMGYASYIHQPDPNFKDGRNVPLMARVKVAENMSPDDLAAFDDYINVVDNYGVEEAASIRCRDCGVVKRVVVPIDATTFLPNLQR
jgi:hypothetical protein